MKRLALPLVPLVLCAVFCPALSLDAQPLPSVDATATPRPSGSLVQFSGQILDVRAGFLFFTTGDGFRLEPNFQVVDAVSGGSTPLLPATRIYARAGFDPQSGRVVRLALSRRPLPPEASYNDVRRFAVSRTPTYPNPELAPNASTQAFTGRRVLVRFTVQVPPNTPLTDDVYLATDASLWDPTAIKLNRIDALHYRIDRSFASGTKLLYRYTRGSWLSSERGQDGLEQPPRTFFVREVDTLNRDDVVYHWGDENQGAPQAGPQSIPTPFNPQPFVTPH